MKTSFGKVLCIVRISLTYKHNQRHPRPLVTLVTVEVIVEAKWFHSELFQTARQTRQSLSCSDFQHLLVLLDRQTPEGGHAYDTPAPHVI